MRHTDSWMPSESSASCQASTCWYTLSMRVPSRSKTKAVSARRVIGFVPSVLLITESPSRTRSLWVVIGSTCVRTSRRHVSANHAGGHHDGAGSCPRKRADEVIPKSDYLMRRVTRARRRADRHADHRVLQRRAHGQNDRTAWCRAERLPDAHFESAHDHCLVAAERNTRIWVRRSESTELSES